MDSNADFFSDFIDLTDPNFFPAGRRGFFMGGRLGFFLFSSTPRVSVITGGKSEGETLSTLKTMKHDNL